MKRVSRSQIAPTGDELIFRRWWTRWQADFCRAKPDEQADFLLGGAFTKRLFLFARMWRLLLRIIPDGAVIYRPSRIFRDWRWRLKPRLRVALPRNRKARLRGLGRHASTHIPVRNRLILSMAPEQGARAASRHECRG